MKAARASADGVERPKLRPARLAAIKQHVAARYGLTVNDLISARKERHATRARHIAMWLCRALSRERHHQTLTSPIKTFTLNLGSPRGQHSCLPTLLECKWAPLMKTSFFAYPTHHDAISETLRAAIQRHNSSSTAITLESWETNDISGIPISNPIFEKIASAQYVAADVTYLNENVAFEIGFTVGRHKRCLLFCNNTFEGERDLASLVGIFDTLGYENYSNAHELSELLLARTDFNPIPVSLQVSHKAPVYIVEPSKRTDAFGIIVSRVKKARWMYRSFNPGEDVRLVAMDAIRHVSQSAGVITPLLSNDVVNQREHNIRAMFVAGLSMALEIPTLIIHSAEFIPPMDVRDFTQTFRHPDDIQTIVQDFSLSVTAYTQRDDTLIAAKGTVLSNLRVGDPTAENEMTTLSQYYLVTDDFQRALRGDVNLVVGRKGSGKTALFVQLRNAKRKKRQDIVIDLKPQGLCCKFRLFGDVSV